MKRIGLQLLASSVLASCIVAVTAGIANAQDTVITTGPAVSAVVGQDRLALSPAQRHTIYRTIVRQPSTFGTAGPTVQMGDRVPARTRLRVIPEQLAVEIPVIKRYRYMVVNNHVLLVDPETSTVAAEIH